MVSFHEPASFVLFGAAIGLGTVPITNVNVINVTYVNGSAGGGAASARGGAPALRLSFDISSSTLVFAVAFEQS
jgi:hypothetical protein